MWAKFDKFGEPPWSEDFVPDGQEEEEEEEEGEEAGGGYEILPDVGGDEVDGDGDEDEDEEVVMVEEEQTQQEYEQREWSDETVEGSERDLDEDWSDGEDAEIARELQEWRDGLL